MNRLNLLTLGVRDIKKSLTFYREGLGFEVVVYGEEENPDIIFFNNAGTKISLYPIEELAKDVDGENPPTIAAGFSGITLAYNGKSQQEVDEVIAKAEKAGATVVKYPQPVFWGGYSGYFQDPDGHYWEIAYGKSWEFDQNDMLVISGI